MVRLFALGLALVAVAMVANNLSPNLFKEVSEFFRRETSRFLSTEVARPKQPETPAQKIERHLNDLDLATARLEDQQVGRIREFFRNSKRGATAFADSVFSWSAKWQYTKGLFARDDGAGFRRFLEEHFEKHVLTVDDVQAALESALGAYATQSQGLENDMLVQLRADLADDKLFRGEAPALQSDEAFKQAYQRVAEQVLPTVANDLKVTLAREVGVFVGAELAAQILGRALATRLAVTGGILGTAANTGVVTFGVGLVAGLVIDYLLDWFLRLVGYDPAREVVRQIDEALSRMESQLIDGDPVAIATVVRLREQELKAESEALRLQYREQAEQIAQSGALGLRLQLRGLRELQSRLRRQAGISEVGQ